MGGTIHVFFKLGSSRNINYAIGHYSDTEFLDNFKTLFPVLGITQAPATLSRMPDYQTIIYLMKNLAPDSLEKIIVQNIRYLLRKKVFEQYRLLDKWYMLTVDGTQLMTFKEPHCKHCLRRKINEDEEGLPIYQYYHYMVSVSLVTENGFCMPILTEFVENESQGVTKQDCELKAFYRLIPRLKTYFQRTQFCFLLDSLFACKPVMALCEQYNLKYITRFKEGSIPSLNQEFESLLRGCSKHQGTQIVTSKISRSFEWVNHIDYEGHKVHVIECLETKPGKKGVPKTTSFKHITNICIHQKNYKQLSKGGRCRWKQENQGFNTQKTGGYNLEHLYAKDYYALKNFVSLLLIAHSISQMIEKGSLLKNIQKTFGSIRNFTKKILIAFTEYLWPNLCLPCNSKYQIRLDSS